MHLSKQAIAALLFIAAAGCGGSVPNANSGDDVAGDDGTSETKKAECRAIEKEFNEIDAAKKDAKGIAAVKALVPVLEKMSQDFQQSPPTTPGLDKATAELAAEADAFTKQVRQINAVFHEMEQINKILEAWQTKVEKVSEEYDIACSKAPKDECEAMNKRVTSIPHLDGDEFGLYAKDLEVFIKLTGEADVKNPGLKTALTNLLGVLGEAIKPMNRLSELLEQPKKLDPAAGQLRTKFNKVREICGIPVRK